MAGKTHLFLELLNYDYNHIQVKSPDYESTKRCIYDKYTNSVFATGLSINNYDFEYVVHLPTGNKTLSCNLIDTQGEIWYRSWQENNNNEWQKCLSLISTANAILLILPPYREIINSEKIDYNWYSTRQQWITRFERWSDFLKTNCSQVSHIMICLNHVDLCPINLEEESQKLAYSPYSQNLNWKKKYDYVYHRFFAPIHPQIQDLNRNIKSSVSLFITSIHNRDLLELPWIYLSCYI
jgi:hypothetical protein